jgi:hypothetical protein
LVKDQSKKTDDDDSGDHPWRLDKPLRLNDDTTDAGSGRNELSNN